MLYLTVVAFFPAEIGREHDRDQSRADEATHPGNVFGQINRRRSPPPDWKVAVRDGLSSRAVSGALDSSTGGSYR
jgi:hypothetical protein